MEITAMTENIEELCRNIRISIVQGSAEVTLENIAVFQDIAKEHSELSPCTMAILSKYNFESGNKSQAEKLLKMALTNSDGWDYAYLLFRNSIILSTKRDEDGLATVVRTISKQF
jgi:hypothetical protein